MTRVSCGWAAMRSGCWGSLCQWHPGWTLRLHNPYSSTRKPSIALGEPRICRFGTLRPPASSLVCLCLTGYRVCFWPWLWWSTLWGWVSQAQTLCREGRSYRLPGDGVPTPGWRSGCRLFGTTWFWDRLWSWFETTERIPGWISWAQWEESQSRALCSECAWTRTCGRWASADRS